MERRTGRRSNFSQSRTKKNCYGSGVKNFAYYAVFLPSFALDRRRRDCDGGRQRERERHAVRRKPTSRKWSLPLRGKVVTFRRFILPPSPVARSLARPD